MRCQRCVSNSAASGRWKPTAPCVDVCTATNTTSCTHAAAMTVCAGRRMPKLGERVARHQLLVVLHLGTDGKATFKRVPHVLEELQKLVGGYLEPIPLGPTLKHRPLLGLVNEDGWASGLPPNPFSRTLLADLFGERLIVGDALVVRERGAEFASLTEQDQLNLRTLLERDGVAPQTLAHAPAPQNAAPSPHVSTSSQIESADSHTTEA